MTLEQAEAVIAAYRSRKRVIDTRYDIERRLIARGVPQGYAYIRMQRIYERLMRDKPSFSDLCKAHSVIRSLSAPQAGVCDFTTEQLEHIASIWADANDPISRACAAVALERLSRYNYT